MQKIINRETWLKSADLTVHAFWGLWQVKHANISSISVWKSRHLVPHLCSCRPGWNIWTKIQLLDCLMIHNKMYSMAPRYWKFSFHCHLPERCLVEVLMQSDICWRLWFGGDLIKSATRMRWEWWLIGKYDLPWREGNRKVVYCA